MTQPPTTDQLRDAIDSGATGEKVAFPDPAAAPLGTDAEAGGQAPTARERRLEADARTVHPHRPPPNGVAVYLGAVAAVALVTLSIGLWAG